MSWPSAATLMTGVSPARHGVTENDHFNAIDRNVPGSTYFFAYDVKADSLWDAAARAGLSTGNVDQLGTVGTTSIRYEIPRFEPFSTWQENVKAIRATSQPRDMMRELEAKLGEYRGVHDQSEIYDPSRTRFAIEIMRRYRPQFLTIHLSGVDNESHAHGPYSAESNAAAERIDGLIGQLRSTALELDPDAVVVVVSDHGLAPVTRRLNLRTAFVEAGLIEIEPVAPGKSARVTNWKADIWGGASAGIMLKDPSDIGVRDQVRKLLLSLAADPANGIRQIVEGPELDKLEGWKSASFVVDMRPGTVIGRELIGPLVKQQGPMTGAHGYLPTNPEMNATFMIAGKGVTAGRNLGQIDMRRIAPTVARAMDIEFKDATEAPLPVFNK